MKCACGHEDDCHDVETPRPCAVCKCSALRIDVRADEFRRRFRFFLAHGDYTVGRHAVDALRLARAEEWAEDVGYVVQWADDDDCDLGDHAFWCAEARRREAGYDSDGVIRGRRWQSQTGCSHECEYAALVDPDTREHLAGLGSIIDADWQYRRVVGAELALDVMSERQQRARNDRESASYLAL